MRTRSVVWSELKLGIVGVVAIALVTVLILAVGGQGGFFWQRYPLLTRFDDVHGLKTGAVVRVNGMEVGRVTSIDFAGSQIEVAMTVAKRVRPLITTDSHAAIGSLSLLGEPIVEIRAASSGDPLDDGAYVRADQLGGIHALGTTASRGVAEAADLMADLREGNGTLGRLIADDSLYRELEALTFAARRVSHQLEHGGGSLGLLLHDPQAYTALDAALSDLRAITTGIRAGQGSLGRLVTDDSLSRSLTQVSRNLELITARIVGDEQAARAPADEVGMLARVDTLTLRLGRLTADLESGRGSAGRMMSDARLYENVDAAATELRGLLADIRRDPQRYLRVQVRLF